jgi:hypothetical protein
MQDSPQPGHAEVEAAVEVQAVARAEIVEYRDVN